jgi:hypothetical protein
MYKLFMVMCVFVNGELKCTTYDDSTKNVYQELSKCEADAGARFYGMTDVFAYYKQDYESLEVGCEEIKEDS